MSILHVTLHSDSLSLSRTQDEPRPPLLARNNILSRPPRSLHPGHDGRHIPLEPDQPLHGLLIRDLDIILPLEHIDPPKPTFTLGKIVPVVRRVPGALVGLLQSLLVRAVPLARGLGPS